MSFESQRREIADIASRLLQEGKVKSVLAYASGDMEEKTIPHFFRDGKDVESIRWDSTCSPNLAKYLIDRNEKVAIAAKPCDARAIVMYLVEKQIKRDNVYIIGLQCEGMVGKDSIPCPGCSECSVRTPPLYDILVENPDIPLVSGYDDEKREKNLEYTLEQFEKELNKCILCYTCRQACYGCYCKTCFADRNIPNWLPGEVDMGTKMSFHLGRAMHLAGRCVECGACERVCPSGVKIRYLIKEVTKMCKDLYGYSAGMDADETPALAAFSLGDREVGFFGGADDESRSHSKEQH